MGAAEYEADLRKAKATASKVGVRAGWKIGDYVLPSEAERAKAVGWVPREIVHYPQPHNRGWFPAGLCWEYYPPANAWRRFRIVDFTFGPDDKQPIQPKGAEKLEGWESDYYKLPPNAKELEDLIEFREMNFNEGNMFKAMWRKGRKPGVTAEYDLYKIIHFAMRELKRLGKPLPPLHPALHGEQNTQDEPT